MNAGNLISSVRIFPMKLVLAFPPLSILVKLQQDDQNSNHFILMETFDDDDADNDDDYGLPIIHLIL